MAATKTARTSIMKPFMTSGPSRGLKVSIREKGLGVDDELQGLGPSVIK